ncbi:MAG: Nramp family divalent metal transporter [Crocinitomicaceae bacterium]|nr:Nramp family divalent metal transporter [Crocinitomicaceae bacterium]
MNNNGHKSRSEVNQSIDTTGHRSKWKRLLAFIGPAYLVSVGYMDPGNWATDIAGGSQFGYSLIWVLLMSNLMALLLQSFSARLGIVRGLDLAQASRETYPGSVNFILYFLAEIAIAACDLAEVLGMAIGLNLLFDLPVLWGVSIAVLDSFLLILLMHLGIRKIEAFILALISVIGLSFLAQMFLAKPDVVEIAKGFIPSIQSREALYIAIGIIGATVMPHNLYLHSALVQTRRITPSKEGMRSAIKFNVFDSAIALNLALFVNAAILILAAAAFHSKGHSGITEIQDAYKMLEPSLGSTLAPVLFAVALIAAGQSSTITGTLAGQIVMEGYLNLRIQPWIRRLITRLIAVIPAFITVLIMGESVTGELLVLSQVILSLQLGFAVIPLIHFVSDKGKMKGLEVSVKAKILAWISAGIIVSLNVLLVFQTLQEWIKTSSSPLVLWLTAVPAAMFIFLLLLYITFKPFLQKKTAGKNLLHQSIKTMDLSSVKPYKRIAVAVDFSSSDNKSLSAALAQGGKGVAYILLHVVESAGAHLMEGDIKDFETIEDLKSLSFYREQLEKEGYTCEIKIGFGHPGKSLPRLVEESAADLVVMGAHGHRGFHDLILGTTVERVRHRISVPLLVVK